MSTPSRVRCRLVFVTPLVVPEGNAGVDTVSGAMIVTKAPRTSRHRPRCWFAERACTVTLKVRPMSSYATPQLSPAAAARVCPVAPREFVLHRIPETWRSPRSPCRCSWYSPSHSPPRGPPPGVDTVSVGTTQVQSFVRNNVLPVAFVALRYSYQSPAVGM